MSIRVPRGSVKDVQFNLLDAPGGSLIDQFNWTDGLTHAQWPTVRFYTAPLGAGTEVTSQVVKDVTSDTITSATHKDPTGSTGVWRKAQGLYRVRVLPQNTLPFAIYYARVSYQPTSGNTYPEDHEFEVISPGDVSFTDYVTPDMVTIGINTSLTDEQIQDLIAEAGMWVRARIRDCRLDPAVYENSEDERLILATIYYARMLVFYRDASSGFKINKAQEGTKRIEFSGNSGSDRDLLGMQAKDEMAGFCQDQGKMGRPRIQIVRRNRPDQWVGCC